MRLYGVSTAGSFVEYKEESFQANHQEATMQSWLKTNPDAIVEDGKLMIIGSEVETDLGGYIDLLALDREGNVAVIELKRGRTPRETLAQALEYASCAEKLDYHQLEALYQNYREEDGISLADRHREHFELGETEAVSFNKDQRLIIVGGEISPAIRQTSEFLGKRGLRVTCLEFSYFKAHSGEQLLSTDIVVGAGPSRIIVTPSQTDRNRFLTSCDEAGKAVHSAILQLADEEHLPLRWRRRGYSLYVDAASARISLAYGYPPGTNSNENPQCLFIAFDEMQGRIGRVPGLVKEFRERLNETGLFGAWGTHDELCYRIDIRPTENQISILTSALKDLAERVKAEAERDKDD